MWEKLLGLFKDKSATENVQSAVPGVEEIGGQTQYKSAKLEGPSTNIGYNYLKGMDGDYEDSSKQLRRFINLNKLLRGNYNGKITATDAEPEVDLRGEDSK